MLICALAVAGCAPSPSRGLADDDAAFKIPAIKQAVAENDKDAAAQLVQDLESDDSAVRFYAIEGLRRLTGQTFEYHYYDSEIARKPAVDQWKRWLAEQPSKPRKSK